MTDDAGPASPWSATRWAEGVRVDYLICDEACFYTVAQVEQMADLVDGYDVDVYAFGLATDFRSCCSRPRGGCSSWPTRWPGIQVEVLCWCGREGLLNARVVDGGVAREGAQVVIGDTVDDRRRALPGAVPAALPLG